MSRTDLPNIVLVTYDSLRADHCGFMGYERETTPTLDAMAAEGLAFENAVASGVPTIASMTAVMTGEHSLASPEIGFDTAQREQVTSRPTIAEVLSEAGYSTGALSPNPPASSYFGFDSGFDWFEDFLAEDTGVVERAWNRVFERSIEGGGLSTYLRLFKNVVTKDEILRPWTDFYDELLAWRERVEEPYFLWVLLLEPHHPWMPPTDGRRWSSRGDRYRAFRQYYEMFTNGWTPDFEAATHERLVNLYDDSIRYGDSFLERLRADLAADDPVIAVHADHGEEFGEHGRYGHQPHLTEELIHVPLVVWNAGIEGTVTDPVELRQLAPTIGDLAGADHPFAAPSLFEAAGAGGGDRSPGGNRSAGGDRSEDGDWSEGSDGDRNGPSVDGTRPWVTAKVFAEGQRRAAVRTVGGKYLADGDREALYDLRDGGEAVDRSEESPEARSAFADALALHVASEREKRAVRSSVEEVDA